MIVIGFHSGLYVSAPRYIVLNQPNFFPDEWRNRKQNQGSWVLYNNYFISFVLSVKWKQFITGTNTFANVYTCKYACSLYKIMFTNIVRGGFIIMVLKLEQSSIYYSSDLKKKRINQFIQFWFIQNVRLYVTTWPWREQNFHIGKCINRDN